ncbi:MAG: hypothetical protein VSS75_026530 [Candidatus Parabeggiatoa sp.]|nr:hypothetical protein [Candidatus Parabeggiatoa sp.]
MPRVSTIASLPSCLYPVNGKSPLINPFNPHIRCTKGVCHININYN